MSTLRRMINRAMNEHEKQKAYNRENRMRELKAKKLLTSTEAAEYLGISVPTFRNIVLNGGVPFVLLGKLRRFYPKDLDSFIENQYCKYEEN